MSVYNSDNEVDNYYDLDERYDRTQEIHELDLSTMKPCSPDDFKNSSKNITIGRPGSGKTTLLKSIMYAKKHIFPVAQVFSGSESQTGFFGEFIPSSFIYTTLDIKNLTPLENFMKRQHIAKTHLEPIGKGYSPMCINIIDDLTYDNKYLKSVCANKLFKNGRHYRMMHILSLQFSLDIPSVLRGCIDKIFIMKEGNSNMRKRLYENYGSCVENQSDWNDLMDGLTDNYSAMVINNSSQSSVVEDNILYYKADINAIPKDWKFGCKDYWDFHYARYDPNYVEPM